MQGALAVSIDKALAAGLTFRPLAETVRDTLAWDEARPAADRGATGRLSVGSRPVGLTCEREAELLAAWHSRS